MFSKTAQYYDLIYGFKDYAAEAAKIVEVIRREHPKATCILDVACGTAEHARHLSADFLVDGIDLDANFAGIAKGKIPGGSFWTADMSDFDLGKKYDVVLCLFSSIGYLKNAALVTRALDCFRKHLNPGGIIIVEPWFTPASWRVGARHMVTAENEQVKICRMSVSGRRGNVATLEFQYLVATEKGVEHLAESHELALYTVEEMLECFAGAGLKAEHDPVGIFGRGLYVARVDEAT